MMSLIEPSIWGKPWILSEEKEKSPVLIPPNTLKYFGKQDVLVLDFLYRSFLKKLKGVILNEEEDLNPQLQVSSFLGALYTSLKNKFLVLILCPDTSIVKWHYYMSQCGQLDVKIITPSTVPEDFDQESGIVLLLSFTNIKLATYLQEYDLFSVVIDQFDEVATKIVIRKLQGNFNIGITTRNFYVDSDPKLKWTMLNWANNGCVGKLADFYEIDNENFACSLDNYKEWWFRLTWNFCETFVKPSLEEKGNLNITLKEWAKTHNLTEHFDLKPYYRKRKVAVKTGVKNEDTEAKDNVQSKRAKKIYNKNTKSSKKFNMIPYTTASTSKIMKNEENVDNLDAERDLDIASLQSSSNSSDSEKEHNNTKRKKNNAPESKNNTFYNKKTKDSTRKTKVYNKASRSIPPSKKTNIKTKNEQNFIKDTTSSDSSDSSGTVIYENESYMKDETADPMDVDEPPIGGSMPVNQNTPKELSKEATSKKDEKLKEIHDKEDDIDNCKDETDSLSYGEQLLYSLMGTNHKKSPKKFNRQIESQNYESEILDDSDLFLRSMASSSSSFPTLQYRQKSKEFFDKILDRSDEKPVSIASQKMELELREHELFNDDASESDNFLKGFSNLKKDSNKNDVKEEKKCSQDGNISLSNDKIDYDALLAEVKEMVERK